MSKDFEEPIDGVPAEKGSEAQASGPDSQGDVPADDNGLTVEDILGAQQTDEATVADAPAEDHDLLLDLKRLQAEYANYRRRTEDQREAEIDRAKGSVAKSLLPVLDDLDRADKHGDLTEGSALAVIAGKLRTVVAKLGVETYGAVGDAFDPQQHEAIFQAPTPGTETATILEVVEVGYRLGGNELRPAKVVVAVPVDGSEA
ncbi:nucleotide exchange factor GrpE [Microbacterium sp.]|uniref:nucleotide exchange factor GrpE n=1 Tax=Microbacterium sp. TaxID=51671 RepID=UPI0025D5BCDF|nr:nucleotide exchange factor GrpE [Microbacterium sp.]